MAIKRNRAKTIKVIRNGQNIKRVMRNNKVLFEIPSDNLGRFYDENGNVLATFTIEEIETTYSSSNGGLAKVLGLTYPSIRKVVLPKGAVKIGSFALYSLNYADECILPEGLTAIGSYGMYGFGKNASNPKLDLPSTLRTIGQYAFVGCGALNLVLPEGFTGMGTNCFYNSSLASISLPSTLEEISTNAFYTCKTITEITIPYGVKTIGKYAFSQAYGLTSINIADSVTTIEEQAFSYCTKPTSITIPNSVTKIGTNAFKNVKHIYYNGSATGSPWGAVEIN